MNYKMIDYDIASDHADFIAPHILQDSQKEEYGYICAYTDDDIFTGMVVFSSNPGDIRVLSIMVSPQYQRQGVAKNLLAYAGSVCIGAGISHIRCSYTSDEDGWVPVHNLLTKCNYELLEEHYIYEIKIEDLKDTIIMKTKALPLKEHCVKLKDLPKAAMIEFNRYLVKHGIFEPINRGDYNQEYSLFYVKDGKVLSCVLYSEYENGDMEISFAFLHKDFSNQKFLAYLFMASGQMIYNTKKGDTHLSIAALSKASEKLVKHILPDSERKYSIREYERDILHTYGYVD